MDSALTVFLFLTWAIMTSLVVSWILYRANAQIRRFESEKTPKKRVDQLHELLTEIDERTLSHARKIELNRQQVEDVGNRVVGLGNRIAAQKRRDAKLDPTELADYIQALNGIPDQDDDDEPGTIAETADGATIDFR